MFHHLANLFEYPTRGCHVWQLCQSSCISRQWIPAWNDPEIGEDIAYQTHSTVLGSFKNSRILYWLILMTSLYVCFGLNGFMTTFLQVVDLFTLKLEAKTTAHSTSSRASVKCFEGWTCLKSEEIGENCGWNHVTRCSRYVICIRLFPWFILPSMFHAR